MAGEMDHPMLKKLIACLLFALFLPFLPARAANPDPAYQPVAGASAVEVANFYLLTLLRTQATAHDVLSRSPALKALATARDQRIATAGTCTPQPACLIDAYLLTDAEIETGTKAVVGLSGDRLVVAHMRPSGYFQRHAALDDAALLTAAWRDAALALNRILRVYGKGEAPLYPTIDAVSFDVTQASFASLVLSAHNSVAEAREAGDLFFQPLLRLALTLLYVNEREDAGRFQPLDQGENKAAGAHAAGIDFSRYRYSALLVLGDGPDEPGSRLGSFGKLRVMAAARRWQQGLAPLIIVSGGNVHPNHTPINEAVEMKRELVERYAIPANAILIEPHARHTTTNLRNAARLMFRYGIPFDKDALIVTSESQSRYTEGPVFAERNLKELGYLPARIGARVSGFDLIFRPEILSLHRDALDPLDP